MSKEEKEYNIPDPESQLLSEKAIANSQDVNAQKQRVIEYILDINNLDQLEQLEELIEKLCMPSGKPPCQYTMDELRERVIQGEKDIAAGNYYSWDEIKAEWESEY